MAAIIKGTKEAIVRSSISTSRVNTIPAIGALKIPVPDLLALPATPDHQGHHLVVHVEKTGHIRTDGSTGQYNRRFRSHRSSKANRNRTGNHGGVVIMRFDHTITPGNRI